ncbi:MAG: PAS domain S-box protein [Nitrospirae bacterium]|nr:PAS domain S-box protein [Nitrospirota bacterium]
MNSERNLFSLYNVQALTAMLFILLMAFLLGLVIIYWMYILEPRLKKSAEASVKALAQMQAQMLADEMSNETLPPGQPALDKRLSKIMDRIMSLKDPNTNHPFVVKIALVADYDILKARPGSLDMVMGEAACKNCIFSEIPLFSTKNREHLGSVQFDCSGESFDNLRSEVRFRLFIGSLAIVLLLMSGWWAVAGLIGKMRKFAHQLAESRQYLDNIISSMHDALFVVSTEGAIRSTNQYAHQMLGYNEDEISGVSFGNIIEEESSGPSWPFLRQELQRVGNVSNVESYFRGKDGRKLEVLLSASKLSSNSGGSYDCLFVARDVSGLKETERQLREKQSQLIHAGRLTALGEMSTGIAHELNQPLSIIRLASEFLREYFIHGDLKTIEIEAVKKIIAQVDRASTIINNMRTFARAKEDDLEPTNIGQSVDRALSFFHEQFRIHGIKTIVIKDDELPMAIINSQKFEQVVVNLLSNARYAVDEKAVMAVPGYEKEIIIRLYHDQVKNCLLFEIWDNGTGMSDDVLKRCMDPFYTTKEVGEGTGLGLSIVHSIVKEYDMGIKANSTEMVGTTFIITIPCAEGHHWKTR